MTSETDGGGVTQTYAYDAFDRMIRVTDALEPQRAVRLRPARPAGAIDRRQRQRHPLHLRQARRPHLDRRRQPSFLRHRVRLDGPGHTPLQLPGREPGSLADAIDAVGSTANPAHAALVDRRPATTSTATRPRRPTPKGAAATSPTAASAAWSRRPTKAGASPPSATTASAALTEQKNATSGQNIARTYDDAGRMTLVNDTATGSRPPTPTTPAATAATRP